MPGARPRGSAGQGLRMVAQVVVDEGLDEPVAVVVAVVPAQPQGLAGGTAGGLEALRLQLLRQEAVGHSLVDEDAAVEAVAVLHQGGGVVLAPDGLLPAEV